MKKGKIIYFIPFLLLLNGCSWSILPIVRNFQNYPITMIVRSSTYTQIDKDILQAFTTDEILDINPKSKYDFNDTLIYQIIDSATIKLIIPPNSTTLLQLPYGWNYRNYDITFEHINGKTDTLGKTLDYTVLNKKGEEIQKPIPHRKQILYIDLKMINEDWH